MATRARRFTIFSIGGLKVSCLACAVPLRSGGTRIALHLWHPARRRDKGIPGSPWFPRACLEWLRTSIGSIEHKRRSPEEKRILHSTMERMGIRHVQHMDSLRYCGKRAPDLGLRLIKWQE